MNTKSYFKEYEAPAVIGIGLSSDAIICDSQSATSESFVDSGEFEW